MATKSRTWKIGDFVFVENACERQLDIQDARKRSLAKMEHQPASKYRKAGWFITTYIVGVPINSVSVPFPSANAAAKWFISPTGQREFMLADEEDTNEQDRYDDWYDEYVSSGDAYRDACRTRATMNGYGFY